MPRILYRTLLIALVFVLATELGFSVPKLEHWETGLVWPISGISLAIVLLFGPSALPGIFLGLFLVIKFGVVADRASPGVIVALLLSLFGTMVVYTVCTLLKFLAPSAPVWRSGKDLMNGYLVIGLSSALVAVFIVLSLNFFGIVRDEDTLVAMGMWLLSNFTGTLIFAPPAYIAVRHYQGEKTPKLMTFATLVSSTIVALALIVFIVLWRSESSKLQQMLQRESAVSASSLTRVFQKASLDLEAIRALVYAFGDVEFNEFQSFMEADINRSFDIPGVQGVGLAPRVVNAALWETQMRNEGQKGVVLYEISSEGKKVPVAARPEYFPVQYIYPHREGNLNAIGFDLASEELRRDTLARCRDTGEISMALPILLVQATREQNAMLLCIPIYQPQADLNSVASRHSNLIGFASGVYTLAPLFTSAATNASSEVNLHFFESSGSGEPSWYHTRSSHHRPPSGGQSDSGAISVLKFAELQEHLYGSSRVNFAGYSWLVVATQGRTLIDGYSSWVPWGVLFLLLTLGLIVSIIFIERSAASEAVELAHMKTEAALREARAANDAKEYFMAAANHDIKQPLYALGILTDTLLMSKPTDTMAPLLRRLKNNIDLTAKHFDALMDIGKYRDGNFDLNLAPTRLGEFASRINLEVAPLCSDKGLAWKLDIEDVVVFTDQELLLRLFRNILINAVRYTDSGEVRCSGKVMGSCVEFEISDTGSGIAMEDQGSIFEAFTRGGKNSTISAEGMGLGLSIVEKINQALKLNLRMSSVVDQGTTFTFSVALYAA